MRKFTLIAGVALSTINIQDVRASSIAYATTEAWFCESCTDVSAAKAIASNYIAPLKCFADGFDDSGRPKQICGAPSKRIVLIQPDSKQIFSFVVRYEFVSSSGAKLKKVIYDNSLSSDDFYGFQQVAEFYYDVRKTFASLSKNSVNNVVAVNSIQYENGIMNSAEDCPAETALNYYLDPDKMNKLKKSIALSASQSAHPLNKHLSNSPRLTQEGVGVSVNSVNYSAQFEKRPSRLVYSHEFKQSEQPNSVMNDRLVFDVTVAGFDSKNWPILGLTLNLPESKIADTVGSEILSGTSGNACVVKAISDMAGKQRVELRGNGKYVGNIGPGSKNPGDINTFCTIDVYQSGKHLYRFIVPKTVGTC